MFNKGTVCLDEVALGFLVFGQCVSLHWVMWKLRETQEFTLFQSRSSPPASQVFCLFFFSYGKMKIRQDSLAYSPFPDFWLSGPVLGVCDTVSVALLWALRCDRIDRWAFSIQSKGSSKAGTGQAAVLAQGFGWHISLRCVGLGKGELVWPVAHVMCVLGTPQTHFLYVFSIFYECWTECWKHSCFWPMI